MRRAAILAGLALVALAAAAGPAGATNECNGLPVCLSVTGPWVVVPVGRTAPRPRVEFQVSCPRGYIVGGLDAELSDRAIDISFGGKLGAPVNPGVTTARAAVFAGVYSGPGARGPTFRPHLGCMPSAGGGGIPTLAVVSPPGEPTVRRVKEVTLLAARTARVVGACSAGERLVGGSHAIAFWTPQPPAAQLVGRVAATSTVQNGSVVATVRSGALGAARAMVQVDVVCAGGQ